MAKTAKETTRKKAAKKNEIKSVTIAMSGANSIKIENHVGRPVGEVKAALQQILNIASDAIAKIDGQDVKDGTIIQQGQKLEFVKKSGTKGC